MTFQPNPIVIKEARRLARFYARFFYHYEQDSPHCKSFPDKKWPPKSARDNLIYSTHAFRVYQFLYQHRQLLLSQNEDNLWISMKLVSGDCGMFAMALQQALLTIGIDGHVTRNGPDNHATFHYDGYHYDGIGWARDDNDILLNPIMRQDLDFDEAYLTYMKGDYLGCRLIQGYCQKYYDIDVFHNLTIPGGFDESVIDGALEKAYADLAKMKSEENPVKSTNERREVDAHYATSMVLHVDIRTTYVQLRLEEYFPLEVAQEKMAQRIQEILDRFEMHDMMELHTVGPHEQLSFICPFCGNEKIPYRTGSMVRGYQCRGIDDQSVFRWHNSEIHFSTEKELVLIKEDWKKAMSFLIEDLHAQLNRLQ